MIKLFLHLELIMTLFFRKVVNMPRTAFVCKKCKTSLSVMRQIKPFSKKGRLQRRCLTCYKRKFAPRTTCRQDTCLQVGFWKKVLMNSHVSDHHPLPREVVKESKLRQCPECPGKFIFLDTLRKHWTAVHADLPFICRICFSNFR